MGDPKTWLAVGAFFLAALGFILTAAVLLWKMSRFTTRVEVYVDEMRNERQWVRLIPLMHMRLGYVEKELGVSSPEMLGMHNEGNSHE